MPLNPQTYPNVTAQSVATGREASSTRTNANVIEPLSHIAGRRMGIYTVSPTPRWVTGSATWVSNGMSGSYYRTHGFFTGSLTSYDDVVSDMRCYWSGFGKDMGRYSTTMHNRAEVFYLQAPQVSQRVAGCQISLTQSLSTNASSTPGPDSWEYEDITGYFYGKWRINVSNEFYRSAEFNGNFGDMGEYQFTTKDLNSIRMYLDDDYRFSTNKMTNIRTTIPLSENKIGFWDASVSLAAGTGSNTANYTRTMYYQPSFTAYPSTAKEE